ncbi:MAG: SigB/SigF/SigG family RNA polymerase sigma factor [Syntrophomonadaceae bacterium]|jgi:RNA polymerase sporulation-specific sigma factor|nr:SigB/SigF/SigG family RNA polymerase sigma factor [Syntrophomonadaceae bacterium]
MSAAPDFQSNEELLPRARQGDELAREEVYKNNTGLLYMVMERFKNTLYDYEDLFQVGSIGLLKAIDNFDFSFGARFSTYAVPMIVGEIKKFIRDDGSIKVQRSLKEKYGKIAWGREKLSAELQREPSISELAVALDMEKEEIVAAMEACKPPAYIYDMFSPSSDKKPLVFLDTLSRNNQNDMLEKLALKEALTRLSPREQQVLTRRFFKDESQAVIAKSLGISQVQVSRVEKAALLKLKNYL